MMKRIMIIVSSWHVGGVTSVIRNQISQFENYDAEVHLVALRGSDQCEVPENCHFHQLDVFDRDAGLIAKFLYSIFRKIYKGLGNPFASGAYTKKLNHLISKTGEPDAIFIHALRPCISLTSFRHERKVCVLHATKSRLLHDHTGASLFFRKLAIEKAYKKSRIIAVGESIKNDFLSTYALENKKIDCIPNGINIEEIIKKSKEYKPDLTCSYIVFVGRLEHVKGPEILLDAFINAQRSDLTLVFIGGGRLDKALREKAKKSKAQVIFKGRLDNPFPYMKHSAYTILPSRSEGMPMTALESLSLGVPVIASRIAPFQEINSPHIDFFEKESTHELEQKIRSLVIPYGKAPSLDKRFDAETSTKKYHNFFKDDL